jgi:hypothetical protein
MLGLLNALQENIRSPQSTTTDAWRGSQARRWCNAGTQRSSPGTGGERPEHLFKLRTQHSSGKLSSHVLFSFMRLVVRSSSCE